MVERVSKWKKRRDEAERVGERDAKFTVSPRKSRILKTTILSATPVQLENIGTDFLMARKEYFKQ